MAQGFSALGRFFVLGRVSHKSATGGVSSAFRLCRHIDASVSAPCLSHRSFHRSFPELIRVRGGGRSRFDALTEEIAGSLRQCRDRRALRFRRMDRIPFGVARRRSSACGALAEAGRSRARASWGSEVRGVRPVGGWQRCPGYRHRRGRDRGHLPSAAWWLPWAGGDDRAGEGGGGPALAPRAGCGVRGGGGAGREAGPVSHLTWARARQSA